MNESGTPFNKIFTSIAYIAWEWGLSRLGPMQGCRKDQKARRRGAA